MKYLNKLTKIEKNRKIKIKLTIWNWVLNSIQANLTISQFVIILITKKDIKQPTKCIYGGFFFWWQGSQAPKSISNGSFY
jgi:hypothetical protein